VPATRAAIGYGIDMKLIELEGTPHEKLFMVPDEQEREARAHQAGEERRRREAAHATIQNCDTTWQTFRALCMAARRS
jgi:hypothetical protein